MLRHFLIIKRVEDGDDGELGGSIDTEVCVTIVGKAKTDPDVMALP